jgi:colicin import membrane protein
MVMPCFDCLVTTFSQPAAVARAAAEAKAAADAKAAKEAADALAKTARDALAAQKGDHKAIFAEMMKQVKSGLTTMKDDVDNEFKAITSKRNAAQDVLNARITSAKQSEKSFSDATVALQTADQACTTDRNTAVSTASALAFATNSLNSRNPIIEKELAVIRQLVDKVGELKTINLQESADQEATRSAAYGRTRDMIASLQTFEQEAAPLSEMLEMAREHAEFTKPILDLLKQLEAKLQAELNSLKTAVTSAQSENTRAQSSSQASCGVRAVKEVEQ